MSGAVRFTDAARGQLRVALDAVARRDAAHARELLDDVRRLVRDARLLEAEGSPLPEFPRIPTREVPLDDYRLFFRREKGDFWITGIWKRRTS
jgi:plasmid stabilization system protein ParE